MSVSPDPIPQQSDAFARARDAVPAGPDAGVGDHAGAGGDAAPDTAAGGAAAVTADPGAGVAADDAGPAGRSGGPDRRVRFRYSGAVLAAALVTVVAAVPLATAARWLLPVLLVPGAVAVWAWRAGTVADAHGITVTALLGRRRIAWDDIAAIGPQGSRTTAARLNSGQLLTLPAVRPTDVPQLAAAARPARPPA